MNGGATYFLSRLPFELGTFLALIGGELEQSDLNHFGYCPRQKDDKDFLNISRMKHNVLKNADYLTFTEMDIKTFDVEINRDKDNHRVLRETLDRMLKEDGKKVILDTFYRKKIVEYANVLEANKPRNIERDAQVLGWDYGHMHNNYVAFEKDVLNGAVSPQLKDNYKQGMPYKNRAKILALFSGRSLEEIYENLENDGSLFAKKCLAVMKHRDQNVLRANFFLVKNAVNWSFSETLFGEHKIANLLTINSDLCPNMFENSESGTSVFNDSFNPDSLKIKPDLKGNSNLFIFIFFL